METVPSNVKVLTEIQVYRNGKLLHDIKPYETAGLLDKVLFHLKLKNLTRSN
jgi:hypothetical protein